MKEIFITIAAIVLSNFLIAQNLEGPYCKGGSEDDSAWDIVTGPDGNYIFAGNSKSSDGDLNTNNGSSDVWLYNVSPQGALIWSKNYGESNPEYGKAIINANDGGYIVCAYRNLVDGEHSNSDFWIFKVDEEGEMLWQSLFGEENRDLAYSVISANGNGYYITGSSVDPNSNDEFVRVIRINEQGNKIWEKRLLEGYRINPTCSAPTPEGGIIVATSTVDVTAVCNIFKLNSLGNIVWHRIHGDSNYDHPRAIIPISSGGYYIAGKSNGDFWLFLIDENGNLLKSKKFGGSKGDNAYDFLLTAHEDLILVGTTYSDDGDVSGYTDKADSWIICLDPSWELKWQICIGDKSGDDYAKGISSAGDNEWLITGYSDSSQGLFSENKGKDDAWVLKVIEDTSGSVKLHSENTINIYPNPASNEINIKGEGIYEVRLIDKLGKIIHSEPFNEGRFYIPSGLKGSYYLVLMAENGIVLRQLILE